MGFENAAGGERKRTCEFTRYSFTTAIYRVTEKQEHSRKGPENLCRIFSPVFTERTLAPFVMSLRAACTRVTVCHLSLLCKNMTATDPNERHVVSDFSDRLSPLPPLQSGSAHSAFSKPIEMFVLWKLKEASFYSTFSTPSWQ